MLLFWYCWSWDTHLQNLNLLHCHLLKCRDLHKSGHLSGSPFSHQSSTLTVAIFLSFLHGNLYSYAWVMSSSTYSGYINICEPVSTLFLQQRCILIEDISFTNKRRRWKASVCFVHFVSQQSGNTFHNRQVLSFVLPASGNQIFLVQFHGFCFV